MAVLDIEHTGIMVKDLATSIAFYQDVLGLEQKGEIQHFGSERLAFLGSKNSDTRLLELIEGYTGPLSSAGLVHHLAFTVTDIEVEINHLKARGVQLLDDEISVLSDGTRSCFFLGPDGEHLELFQRPEK